MPNKGLNTIIGRMVISDKFRAGMLSGKRQELVNLEEFELTQEEKNFVLSIAAETQADLASEIERWIDTHPEPIEGNEGNVSGGGTEGNEGPSRTWGDKPKKRGLWGSKEN